MIQQNKLLIDKDCPMCDIYGKCFEKMGLIDKETLTTYQDANLSYTSHIDMERAKNEIALFDIKDSTTIYGINAMIAIVSHNRPVFNRVLHSALIYPLLAFLYQFISYNRKIIVPAKVTFGERDCTPDTNIKYRWLYILFVAGFTGIVLNQFVYYINAALGLSHDWIRELYICLGQVAWQGIAIQIIRKEKYLEYLGNMSTVSMIGGILLIPVLVINSFIPMHIYALIISFMGIVGIMFFEHIRRCKLLGIPLTMTFSWVAFRTSVLALVVYLNM